MTNEVKVETLCNNLYVSEIERRAGYTHKKYYPVIH